VALGAVMAREGCTGVAQGFTVPRIQGDRMSSPVGEDAWRFAVLTTAHGGFISWSEAKTGSARAPVPQLAQGRFLRGALLHGRHGSRDTGRNPSADPGL